MLARIYPYVLALVILLGVAAFALDARAAETDAWSLDDAIRFAMEHNPDIKERAAGIEVARQAKDEVLSGFMPQLNLTGGYQYIDNVPEIDVKFSPDLPAGMPEIKIDKSIRMGAADNYKVELGLNQLLFAGGRVYYGYQARDRQVEAKEMETAAARLAVARQTAEAYYGVLIAREVYAAQSAALDSAKAHLEHVTHRFEAGAASRFELLRAQVEVANQEPEVSKAAALIETAEAGLRRVLGAEKDRPLHLAGKLETAIQPAQEAQILDEALKNRPELSALAAGREAFEEAGRSRRGEMLPAVALTGTYGFQKPYYTNLDGDYNWTVGVGLSLPLFDGLRAYRGMKSNYAQAEAMDQSAWRTKQDIRLEIRNASLNRDESITRIASTRANLDRAGDMVAIAENSFTAGAVTSLEVIDAQLAATRARVAYLKALYDYRIAAVRLAAAAGDWQAIGR
ncbi:MAG: TolC family protein [Myxococcales bacterium]|nr:TolC family protein [Myxococcales bacterium]